MSTALEHNLQRKAALAEGGAADHVGRVVIVPDEAFDLDVTIFKSLNGAIPRLNQKTKLGVRQFWNEESALQIENAYASVPTAPVHDAAIINFMLDECDFCCEHADGSFMDHLNFCYHYSALHYPVHSPKVMFLHSIMGVGTNIFPMSADKVPQLRSMLTDFEFLHVQSFPTVLRLLYGGLLQDLTKSLGSLDTLESVTFHRLLDNESLQMDAESFWIQLNYQLMHLLDFLPVACWGVNWDEPIMQVFLELFAFLKSAGKVQAQVMDVQIDSERRLDGQPTRLIDMLVRATPSSLKRRLASSSISKFSQDIGHSLSYELKFNRHQPSSKI